MATLKARLKRNIEYNSPLSGAGTFRIDSFFNFSQPINGWTIDSCSMVVDYTTMCYNVSNVSNIGAYRCTHVFAFSAGNLWQVNTDYWLPVNGLGYNKDAACRQWPCCLHLLMMMPVPVAITTGGVNNVFHGYGGELYSGINRLGLKYGTSDYYGDQSLRIYSMIDIALFEGTV